MAILFRGGDIMFFVRSALCSHFNAAGGIMLNPVSLALLIKRNASKTETWVLTLPLF